MGRGERDGEERRKARNRETQGTWERSNELGIKVGEKGGSNNSVQTVMVVKRQ